MKFEVLTLAILAVLEGAAARTWRYNLTISSMWGAGGIIAMLVRAEVVC